MTQNIWNYSPNWEERRRAIAATIEHFDPDVVCLQETRHDFRFFRGRGQGEQIAELVGRHSTSRVAQIYWPWPRVDEGLTVLTRRPPRRVMTTRLTQLGNERNDENRRICLGVEIDMGGDTLQVFNTHFSLSSSARKKNAQDVLSFIRSFGDGPAVLMGDLNCEPESEPLQYLVGTAEIEGTTGDFVDCWAVAGSGGSGETYSAWNPHQCIDFALSRGLAGRIKWAQVVGREPTSGVYASDHLGIIVDIDC